MRRMNCTNTMMELMFDYSGVRGLDEASLILAISLVSTALSSGKTLRVRE